MCVKTIKSMLTIQYTRTNIHTELVALTNYLNMQWNWGLNMNPNKKTKIKKFYNSNIDFKHFKVVFSPYQKLFSLCVLCLVTIEYACVDLCFSITLDSILQCVRCKGL